MEGDQRMNALIWYVVLSFFLTAFAGVLDRTREGPIVLSSAQRYAAFMALVLPTVGFILAYYAMLPLGWLAKRWVDYMMGAPLAPTQDIRTFFKEKLNDDPRTRPN
jgi:hypothetical protein